MQKSLGFTLIELLVVVLIIGILAAVALPQYQKAVLKSRQAQALVIVKSLQTYLVEYNLANGEFPNSIQFIDLVDFAKDCSGSVCRIKDYLLYYSKWLKTGGGSGLDLVVVYAPLGQHMDFKVNSNDESIIGAGISADLDSNQLDLYCYATNKSAKALQICEAQGKFKRWYINSIVGPLKRYSL